MSLNGTALAGSKNCKISLSQEFIEACSPTESRVFTKIPTTYDWQVAADCLIPNSSLPNNLTDYLLDGTRCLLTYADGSGQKRAGFVYVKKCVEGGNIGSLTTFNTEFESSGALYRFTQYTAMAFTEGAHLELSVSDGEVVYDFDSQSVSALGVEISVIEACRLYICFNDSAWAAYGTTFANVKNLINNSAYVVLNGLVVACGAGDSVEGVEIELPANSTTTVLVNDIAAADNLIFKLY